MYKIIGVLKNQQGMQTIEVVGLAVVALIILALVFNKTKGGMSSTSLMVCISLKDFKGNMNSDAGFSGIPDTINIK